MSSNGELKYDLVVFTAPSGAGKTTIAKHLLKTYKDQLSFSTSATTRSAREGEVDGRDYYFMSEVEFKERVDNEDFIEWEEVYEGRYYGTLKEEVERLLSDGKKVVFDVDIIGAQNIKDKFDERCLVIFVKPPSFRELVSRLTNRGSETPHSLKKRIQRIKKELLFENTFDMVLLNDDLSIALTQAEEIIKKHVID